MEKMRSIKLGFSVILLFCSTTTLMCQAAMNQTAARPSIRVEFENEILSLAKGYEQAFRKLPAGGKYIEISTPTGPKHLKGSVKSVEALEGVLLIQMKQGLIHIISAKDIIKLTNEKPSS